ncbi:S-methyl-5-thioribose-1-phosphate isomerase [Candidatus Bathyarchaeota archaeon]|nr:S-methyl-5-thioribose-1-phosphate isomerase [Candidatus Bathyarchaeota archaeon]
MSVDEKLKKIFAIKRENKKIKLIDQRLLPHKVKIITLHNYNETIEAIRDMAVRGAGSIGVAAGYGLAQAALEAKHLNLEKFNKFIKAASDKLLSSRPTAINLRHSIDRCLKVAENGTVTERIQNICNESDKIAFDDIKASRLIGVYGEQLLKENSNILTHCNAGALAYIDQGTALSPIIEAKRRHKPIFVYVDETRPRNQGAKITAWELSKLEIPYALIVDNAAGYFMINKKIDVVIVGADRIAVNGDTANKIGTYEKAVLAKENNIPFYVAAPSMSFDLKCESGERIEIEHRSSEEITHISGVNDSNEYTKLRITAKNTKAYNPSFDITPAKYISGFITEKGLLKKPFKKSIKNAFK